MSELPNLHTVGPEFEVSFDLDRTLAPSNAFDRLYAAIGDPDQLRQEFEDQRKRSRAIAKAQGSLIVPPYNILEHLGSNPDKSYGLDEAYGKAEEELLEIALEVRQGQPDRLYPDARKLLGRIAWRGVTIPVIRTYGHDFTQRLKVLLDGLDGYGVSVTNGLKADELSRKTGPGMHTDDLPKHLPAEGSAIIGVLYNPPRNWKPVPASYQGPVIGSHDELWR